MAINTNNIPNLGNIIENPRARFYLWAAYGLTALAFGALQTWFGSVEGGVVPEWVNGGLDVLAYLAIPFAGLAMANVPTKPQEIEVVEVVPLVAQSDDKDYTIL